MNPISVFDYFDYRAFLKDKFEEAKARNSRYSIRLFNRLAGARSTSFLKNVLESKRNLADDGIFKMARGFRLNEAETRFFSALVKFNQAVRHDERDHYFQEMGRHRRFIQAKLLEASHYNLYSHWYYSAILEAIRTKTAGRKKDVKWLGARLVPKVDSRSLRKALHDLKKIGLLEDDKKEGLKRRESMVTTPDSVRSLGVSNFHIAMSGLAAQAVARETGREREFSALTIALSPNGFERAKKAVREFRKALHSLLEQEDVEPRTLVAQINLQLFKLAKSPEGDA